MKKILLAAVITAAIGTTVSAQTNVVSSANIVGYNQINLEPGGKFKLIACNFETGDTNTLLSVFGTNQLAQSDFLAGCDIISIWDSSNYVYQRWAQWTDGNFYKANTGTEWAQALAGNPEIPLGSALWIQSAGGSSTTNTITISGDVVANSTQSVVIVDSFQMVSYPYSTDIALNDSNFKNSGAASSDFLAACDKISVWTGSGYQRYALWTDGKWYKANDGTEWAQAIMATNIISMGEGVWYEAVSGFIWSETNRYSQAFE